jgi:hypothetical protein
MGGRHRVRMSGRGGEVELRHRTEVDPAMQRCTVDRSDIHAWLAGARGDERRALFEALEDLGFHGDPRDGSAENLARAEDRLVAALDRGELVAVRPVPRPATVAAAKKGAPPQPAKPAEKKAPVKISWINIQLVDEKKSPVKGVRFHLTMPDKTTKEGVLDDHGSAHVEGIPDGSCEIRFPDLDTVEWNVG